jgi:hypothetical protein
VTGDDVIGRPTGVALVAAALVLTAVVSAVIGMTISALDGCCGSSEPGSSTPTLFGLVVGVAVGAAGIALWRGGVSRWLVLGPSAVVPVALVAAGWSSVDLGALAPVAGVGWLLLLWFLRRESATAWLAARRDAGFG